MSYLFERRIYILRYCACLIRPLWAIPILVFLLFFGAIFWAKSHNPFSRKWFTVHVDGHPLKCVAVLPRLIRKYPVVIYAHGSRGNLMSDGFILRQMAEIGLAVISLECDQTNTTAFPLEIKAVQNYLARQNWADTNAIAWVGFGLSANRIIDLALRHPESQPQLLVQLSGAGLNPCSTLHYPSSNLHCPVLLIHSDQDETFPISNTQRLTSLLRSNGVPVQLKILHGLSPELNAERGVIFRCIGEYCRTHLLDSDQRGAATTSKTEIGKSFLASAPRSNGYASETKETENEVWQHYHSLAQFEAEAPPFWPFCLPATAWAIGYYVWRRRRNPFTIETNKLCRHEIALRWLAAILGIWAAGDTAMHLIPPHLAISPNTLAIARRYLIQPKERSDFDFLASQCIWRGQKLKALLDQVELSDYNRELINWKLDEKIFRNYVLSSVIQGSTSDSPSQDYDSTEATPKQGEDGEPSSIINPPSSNFNWRRPLWEEFYPRIRHKNSPADAARIVVRHLRERITIANLPNLPDSASEIWLRQITDEKGFQIIYVAALRAVGVPARLDVNGEAEFYDGKKWEPTPLPCVISWSPGVSN